MKSFFDGESGIDNQLPTGGEVLGYLADAFQLKGRFDEEHGWEGSDRTARRYLNGKQEKVAPETAREIIEHLVESLFPDQYFAEYFEIDDEEMRERIVAGITRLSCGWDIVAGQVNGYRFPNEDPGLAALPALRLATFSFGIHWGALIFRQFDIKQITEESPGFPLPWWFRTDCAKFIMDAYWEGGEEKHGLKGLAKKAGFNPGDITNWRSGKHRPKPYHLQVLAQTLTDDVSEANSDNVEFLLCVATGIDYLRGRLEDICGDQRIDDLLGGFLLVAKSGYLSLSMLEQQGHDAASLAREVAEKGPFCEEGAGICRSISAVATGSPFVAADLEALPGDWTERLQYWAKMLAKEPEDRISEQLQLLNELGLAESTTEKFARVAEELPLRTKDFTDPEHVVLLRLLRENGFDPTDLKDVDVRAVEEYLRPYHLIGQAEARFSVGDIAGGLGLVQEAIEANPEDAALHYKLGCRLGQAAVYHDATELAERAIQECEMAATLESGWGRPKNEIGVIFSNMRRFEEAESAFAAAAPLNEEWHQHHLNRGQNLMWLGQYDDAIACFDKSKEVDPNDLRATEAKGICLLATGNRQRGKPLLTEVARRTGRDWLTDDRWKQVVDGPNTNVEMAHPVMGVRKSTRDDDWS
jgi:tetratricopeptide (TPR) repeat protein